MLFILWIIIQCNVTFVPHIPEHRIIIPDVPLISVTETIKLLLMEHAQNAHQTLLLQTMQESAFQYIFLLHHPPILDSHQLKLVDQNTSCHQMVDPVSHVLSIPEHRIIIKCVLLISACLIKLLQLMVYVLSAHQTQSLLKFRLRGWHYLGAASPARRARV